MIRDHAFRGLTSCIYGVPSRYTETDFELCGAPEGAHRESIGATSSVSPLPSPHWFIGLRSCLGCDLGFDHPAHYLSPSRVKLVGLR
jgi:hypothetical protein